MEKAKFTANINGGDGITPNDKLTFRIYGGLDGFKRPIKVTGTSTNDSDVSITADVVEIDNIKIGVETLFKIASVDEARNESIISDVLEFTYIQPFIIEVDTSNGGRSGINQFEFTGAVGDYDVIANKDNVEVDVFKDLSGQATITLPEPGVYELKVLPKPTNSFSRIRFSDGGDKLKLTDIKQWGGTIWSSFDRAFFGCSNFKGSFIDSPNLTNVNSFRFAFREATLFNQPINNWDTSNVTNMERVFGNATSFNQRLDNWDVSNVTITRNMFVGASSFNQNINSWDVSKVRDMGAMFNSAVMFNQPLDNWDVSSVTFMTAMFSGATSFNQPLNSWDTSSVTTMLNMFITATSFNQPLNNWDVSSVTNFSFMFRETKAFNQPLNNWDTSSATNMAQMFLGNPVFNQNINSWDVSSVTDFSFMFNAFFLTEPAKFNKPLNNWDMSSALTINNMFSQSNCIFNQDISEWNTSNITDMQGAFFANSRFNQDISTWDTSSVTNMSFLFNLASSFNRDLSNWDVNNVTTMESMFDGSSLSAENLTLIYENWSLLTLQENVIFGAEGIKYNSSGQTGKDIMLNTYDWIITDGGL